MTKSVPLTNIMRDSFIVALLHHRFDDEAAEMCVEEAALADAVYLDIYKPSIRAKMQELPREYLPEGEAIAAKFGEGRDDFVSLRFAGRVISLGRPSANFPKAPPKKQTRRMSAKHTGPWSVPCAKVYPPEHKLVTRVMEHVAKRQDTSERISEASEQIRAIVWTATSTKQLRARWPEAEPFIAALEAKAAKPALPAPPMAKLNAILGLPVEGEVA